MGPGSWRNRNVAVNDLAAQNPSTVVSTMTTGRAEASYRRIHDRLWRSLFAYSGDAEIASDAESEAFSQALRREDKIADVDAWVWKASFQIAAGLLKKRTDVAVSVASVPESGVFDRSTLEFLSQLQDLSDQQRLIVALRYVANYRPAEIADLIESTPGSVRVQLHRAHDQLRTSLGGLK